MIASVPLQVSFEEQLESTWETLAFRRFAEAASSQAAPVAVLVIGAPGIDIAVVMELTRQSLSEPDDCVWIDPLELMLLHPLASIRQRNADWDQHHIATAAQLSSDLFEGAMQRRQHIVAHCPLETSQAADTLIATLLDDAYQVRVVAGLTDSAASWARLQERQRSRIGKRLPSMTRAIHDERCRAVIETIQAIELTGHIDELHLLDEGGRWLTTLSQAGDWRIGTVANVLKSLDHRGSAKLKAAVPESSSSRQLEKRREFLRTLERFAEQCR